MIKRQFVRRAGSPRLLRWGAPGRTFRQLCGWRPGWVPLAEARRILVIRPDEIGDLVLTGPFLRELRRVAPQANITLLVKPGCHELMRPCPYVDAVVTLNFAPRWDKPGYRLRLCREALAVKRKHFESAGFDLVLLPRREADTQDSILIAHLLAGEGAIVAHETEYGNSSGILPPRPPVHFETVFNPVVEHEVLHNLHFLELCGAPQAGDHRLELWLEESDRSYAAGVVEAGRSYVAMGTGAGDPNRCWPVERFAALADWLQREYGLKAILLGAKGDPAFGAAVNLLGKTSLRQAAAVMAKCSLFIGNDSGLLHVAAAMGTPAVEISGFRVGGEPGHANSPVRFHPWGVPNQVVQPVAGLGRLCMDEVSAAQVRAACARLLSQ